MHRSKIEWVLNPDNKTLGWVWNPITGCLNGCEYCYARKLANGRLKPRYTSNSFLPTHDEPDHEAHHNNPFYPRFWPSKILQPWDIHGKLKPKGIFVCNMSDLFGIGIPEKWTGDVLDVIRFSKTHRFYLLTKQPQNLEKFSPFPKNCWVGATATNQKEMDRAIKVFDKLKKKVNNILFISCEPLMEKIETDLSCIDWIIIGGRSKSKGMPAGQPKWIWVEDLIWQARENDVPVYAKPNLTVLPKEYPKAIK